MRRHYSYGYAVVMGALAFGITLFGFASARDIVLSSVCAFGVGVCVVAYQTQRSRPCSSSWHPARCAAES